MHYHLHRDVLMCICVVNRGIWPTMLAACLVQRRAWQLNNSEGAVAAHV